MPFNLEVSFIGLCLFVPNKTSTKICVVLPNAEGNAPNSKKSLDGTWLSRHRAFLRFDMKNLKGMPQVPEDSLAVWHLTRRELKIDTIKDNPFKITALDKVLNLLDIAPDFCVPDPDVVTGDTDKITSRLLIEQGEILTGEPTADAWRVPPTLKLCGGIVRYPALSTRVILKIEKMDELILSVTQMTGGTDQAPLHLEAPDGETVKISVVNLCDNNPLQWEPSLESVPDVDFKWYFELLPDEKHDELAKRLSGIELPVPVPEGQPNGRGQNCFVAVSGAIDF